MGKAKFDPWRELEKLREAPAKTAKIPSPLAELATLAALPRESENSVPDEERAAIIEFDGTVPREWAEGYSSLLGIPCPPNIPEERWQLFIDDAGRVLDSWEVIRTGLEHS